MAKAARSPLLGYNHNVKYRGRIFHVQTEDSGPSNPHLFTHLYFEGTILATKRQEYDRGEAEDAVRVLMQAQHKAILKELKGAIYDERLDAFFATRNEAPPAVAAETAAPLAPEAMAFDPMALPDDQLPVVAPLDLDALPPSGDTPPPEALPADLGPPGGPGVYTVKNPTRERPSPMAPPPLPPEALPASHTPPPVTAPRPPKSRPPAPRPTMPQVPPHMVAYPPSDPMPVVVFEPSSPTPPSATAARPTPLPASQVPRVPQRPTAPAAPVVVQRQVVVGVGAAPVVAARTKRPGQSIPYVVKEGSHVTTSNNARPAAPVAVPRAPTQSRVAVPAPRPASPPVAPARPMVPPPATSANSPRTASQPPTAPPPRTASQPPAPQPPPDLISDRSLDEVILAYLSSGDKRE